MFKRKEARVGVGVNALALIFKKRLARNPSRKLDQKKKKTYGLVFR
jgi:hypothetical protein